MLKSGYVYILGVFMSISLNKFVLFLTAYFAFGLNANSKYGQEFVDLQKTKGLLNKTFAIFEHVGQKNYPELYAKIGDISKKMGIRQPICFCCKFPGIFLFRNNAAALVGPIGLLAKIFGGVVIIGSDIIEHFTESELEFIIAHEMKHLSLKHQAIAILSGINLGRSIAMSEAGNADEAFAGIASSIIIYSMERGMEKEADANGLKIIKNKKAACSALKKLDSRLSNNYPILTAVSETISKISFGLFDSHPSIEDRCKSIKWTQV